MNNLIRPTKEEVEKYQTQAAVEYGLSLTFEEAEKMLAEVAGESSANERR